MVENNHIAHMIEEGHNKSKFSMYIIIINNNNRSTNKR